MRDGWWQRLNGTLNSVQDVSQTEELGDREEDGKTISTNSNRKSTESEHTLWIKAAEDRGRWILLAEGCTMTAEKRAENSTRHRRNHQNRPARCSTDVSVANIT